MTKQIHFNLTEPRFEGVVLLAKIVGTGAVLIGCVQSIAAIIQIALG